MDGERGNEPAEAMRAEMAAMFAELRRFVDRRITELSTEIHATVQMVDFSESNLSAQLERMHAQLTRLVALPNAATRNSGVELEAVVQATEEAVVDVLVANEEVVGFRGHRTPALPRERVVELLRARSAIP